jgi:hypothetical protein
MGQSLDFTNIGFKAIQGQVLTCNLRCRDASTEGKISYNSRPDPPARVACTALSPVARPSATAKQGASHWNHGMMERWGTSVPNPIIPILHHPNTPQHARTARGCAGGRLWASAREQLGRMAVRFRCGSQSRDRRSRLYGRTAKDALSCEIDEPIPARALANRSQPLGKV